MTAISGDDAGTAEVWRRNGLSEADRALLLAMRAWSEQCRLADGALMEHKDEHAFIMRFQDWVEPEWVRRLCEGWDRQGECGHRFDETSALDRLRQMHAASVHAELSCVHPSWLVRALREESPAVQRLVAGSLPDSLRRSIQAGLLLDGQDIVPDRPVHPIVKEWVMGLWTERLVGGDGPRVDDPAAVVAICGLSPRAGYRLCRMAGLCKMVLAVKQAGQGRVHQLDRERADWLLGRLSESESAFQVRARGDVETIARTKLPRRLQAARIGLFTFARLLAQCEPFRLRWVLQQWPYPIVKLIRSMISGSDECPASLLRGETLLLKTAWDRLRLEERLAVPWPERTGVEHESR